jgi:hypothetical protein
METAGAGEKSEVRVDNGIAAGCPGLASLPATRADSTPGITSAEGAHRRVVHSFNRER